MTNNESIWDKINSNFAQGGSVNKENSMYAEGGFLDDGASVDPVSGNEVPSGSLSEEVRDDVPAQLSEGEFVVPADVVRYIGLEKLMQMRDQAKSGLAQMEQEGQMGGSPAPAPEMQMQPDMSGGMEDIDIDAMIDGMEDSSVQSFDVGGFVKRDDGSWQYAGPTEADGFEGANYADLMGNNFGTVPTTDTMTYINADGHKIYIPVIDGKAAYAAPEGYTLSEVSTRDPVEKVTEDPITDADVQLRTDYSPAAREGESREDRQRKVAVSEKVQRKRMSELDALAGADLSQEGIDAMYSALTPQAKNIYNERFRDPTFIDGWMAEGKSSTDLLITAQKTADRLNDERGVTETDDESTYSTEPTTMEDLAKAAKYMAAGLAFGPMGLIGAGMRDMTEAEKEEAARVLKNSLNFFSTSPNQNKDKGRGNQPTETQLTGPTFNQAHWVDRMGTLAGEGLSYSEIQKQLFREKQAIPALYGTDAYGRKLSEGEISSYNNRATTTLKDIQDQQDKKDRTLAKMAADATKKKKEDAIQEELVRIEAEEAQKVKDNNDKQDAAAREAAKNKANVARIAREESVRKAAEDKATQDALREQARLQGDRTPAPTGNGGDKTPPSAPAKGSTARSNRGPGRKGRQAAASNSSNASTNNTATNVGGIFDYNMGGLATKKKPAVKKMRNDPTAGIASKKKAKQKAQAKKGALAAKRT